MKLPRPGTRPLLGRRWRPVQARPGEGWEILPPLRWVLLGGAAALVTLVVCVVAALAGD
ncbi:MAG: hypothetical protein HOV68_17835 [Streptomycetaceae bacterium]|nr:hypothetical protein [Streptomycetaceae bacterium]